MQPLTRYLVLIRLHDCSPARLAETVPALQTQLAALSQSIPEQSFRSLGADMFGYFIDAKISAHQIVAAIESPGRAHLSKANPFLDGKDALFVMEVGKDFSATPGFTRAATWLQRH